MFTKPILMQFIDEIKTKQLLKTKTHFNIVLKRLLDTSSVAEMAELLAYLARNRLPFALAYIETCYNALNVEQNIDNIPHLINLIGQ